MARMNPRRRDFLSALTAGCLAGRATALADAPISLFDGKTLKGWKQEGGAAWSVHDGAIVGRQGPGETAGDLFTLRKWADFELEAEWKMHWPGNSGIWFRYTGPRTGYQADILDEPGYPGVLPGSLYCAGKLFLAENRDPATVHRHGWNTLRIRAVGDEISIAQNGTEVVVVRDHTYSSAGSIGIQVHPGRKFKDMEIRVRNIRLFPLQQDRG